MSYNKIQLLGNLGKDPQTGQTSSGKSFTRGSIATTRSYKNPEGKWIDETQWHQFVLWGPPAERFAKSCKKGNKLFLEGRMTYRSYEAQDGSKRYVSEVLVNSFENLAPKPEVVAA